MDIPKEVLQAVEQAVDNAYTGGHLAGRGSMRVEPTLVIDKLRAENDLLKTELAACGSLAQTARQEPFTEPMDQIRHLLYCPEYMAVRGVVLAFREKIESPRREIERLREELAQLRDDTQVIISERDGLRIKLRNVREEVRG